MSSNCFIKCRQGQRKSRFWAFDACKCPHDLLANEQEFLVSGRDLACQQEVSLALTKTPPIRYYNVVDGIARSAITRGSCVFNAREHRVTRDASVRKRNLRA